MHERSEPSFLGHDLASSTWLQNHFLSKANRRLRQISDLPIKPGDHVLDVCCGPGIFTDLFALQVSPGGEVVGLDQDPSHIDEAERRSCQLQTADVVSYHCCDATGPLPEVLRDRLFDVIVLFNCICYFSNPAEVLARYWQRLRPGGRLLVRDSDMGHFLVSPFDDSLQSRVIAAAKKGGGATFDNFFGRNLFGLVSAIPSARTQVQVWPYPMSGSLTE